MKKERFSHRINLTVEDLLLKAAASGRLVVWSIDSHGQLSGAWQTRNGKRVFSAVVPWFGPRRTKVYRPMFKHKLFEKGGMLASKELFEAKRREVIALARGSAEA